MLRGGGKSLSGPSPASPHRVVQSGEHLLARYIRGNRKPSANGARAVAARMRAEWVYSADAGGLAAALLELYEPSVPDTFRTGCAWLPAEERPPTYQTPLR